MFVSLADLLPEAIHIINQIPAFLTFFGGFILAYLIDRVVPYKMNPHDFIGCIDEEEVEKKKDKKRLFRAGVFAMAIILLHNFPEGVATFFASSYDLTIGISVAIAIAIHNIPEGFTVAVPIYYATGSRKKALGYSILSGLSEPLGALLAAGIFSLVASEIIVGYSLAFAAGLMVFVAFDELYPAAQKYDNGHLAISGVMMGMIIIALSIL